MFLRDVEPDQIENGVLIVYGNDERRDAIGEIRIRDRIAERTERSVKVFTNVKFDKVAFDLRLMLSSTKHCSVESFWTPVRNTNSAEPSLE